MNYFELLNLPAAFTLDLAALESAYFQQQRLYHPDRFTGKPPAEKHAALQRSVDINNAYHTLKNPLPRAQYLLQLQGISVGTDKDTVKPSQALLIEIMELRERQDEISGSLDAMHDDSVQRIAEAYANKHWDAMAQETMRLGYITKTMEDNRRKK